MNKIACIAALAMLTCTSACKRVEPAKITYLEAAKAADAMLAAARSGDIAKIDALYARDMNAINPVEPELATDSATMHKWNVELVKLKFDQMYYTERKIQLLDGEEFIITAKVHATSQTGPVKTADFRLTNVYRKQADGKFKIINEHLSFAAPAAK